MFLLGVVLIAERTRSVLLAVTAFTVAHSITLALSVLEVATVSPRLVEPLIALSVAYVGLENFWLRDAGRRFRLTFAFGLVHGFGFAGVLHEIGVPQDNAAPALALFNLGVEAGQLLVLAGVWPLLLWLRRYPPQFGQLVRVLNVAIVVMGAGWALERTIGGEPAVATDQAAAAPSGAVERGELRHVYATVAPSPLAARVCRATQGLPRERRATCEGTTAGPTLEAGCSRVLSSALASKALQVAPAAADSCIAALETRYADCEFAKLASLQPPAACTGIWQGQLERGAACKSSLECQSGLHCHGAGPMTEGTCGLPKPAGARCSLTPDPLGAYLATKDTDHPECQGVCTQGRCK